MTSPAVRHSGTVGRLHTRLMARLVVNQFYRRRRRRRRRTIDECAFTVGLVDIGHQIGTYHPHSLAFI